MKPKTKSKNSTIHKQYAFEPNGKKILMISAHPDDADFMFVGTLLQWLENGAKAAIVIATNGDKGSHDHLTSPQLAQMRRDEQLEVSKRLGLEQTWFLDYPDAHLEVTQELKEKLVHIIREYKPDAVVTFDPSMTYSRMMRYINHPDHRAVGQAALDAVFPMSRDFLTFPKHKEEGLEPHKVTEVFLYNFDDSDFYVDITEYMEKKLAIMAMHKSQCNMEKLDPYIRKWNALNAKRIGTQYAECFVRLHLD